MAIPNTTQTPNIIFNGLMAKMTDTEFRVVMAVVRATLGWEENEETGMRKKEDWLSYWQLKKITGRGYSALAQAIESCIKKEWIEARDKEGNLLNTKNKRIGKKIFYRLGKEILLKNDESGILVKTIKTSPLSEEVKTQQQTTSSDSVITESVITESGAYKINTIQNKHYTKIATQSVAGKEINDLIEKFKSVNPSYERLFGNTTQRAALERLVKKFGKEKVASMIDYLPKIFGKPYAPRITSPYQLEMKMADLISYLQAEKSKVDDRKIVKI